MNSTAEVFLSFFIFMIAGLAVYRMSRFIVADKLIDRPRDWVHNFLLSRTHLAGFFRWLQALISCGWCISIWFGALVTAAVDYYYDVPLPAFYALALAAFATGYWGVVESDDD